MKKTTIHYCALLLCLCSLNIGCKWYFEKHVDNCDGDVDFAQYEFHLPFTFIPAQDTFRINDTITLQAHFSDLLLDSLSLKYYRAENIVFECAASLSKIDTLASFLPLYAFTYEVVTGGIFAESIGDGFMIKFDYEEGVYKFEVNIVPQKTGLYAFNLSSLALQEVDFQQHCRDESMNVFFSLNNGEENNYHLLSLSPEQVWSNMSFYDVNRLGIYVFHVVE